MEEEWITDDAAVEWQCREYAIPPAVAESRLRKAWELGYVPMRETITRVIEEPNGEFRGEYIPPRLGPLGLKHEPRLHFEVLRWQIEQLFGKPKPPRAASTNQKPAQDAVNAALLAFAKTREQKIKQNDSDACDIRYPELREALKPLGVKWGRGRYLTSSSLRRVRKWPLDWR